MWAWPRKNRVDVAATARRIVELTAEEKQGAGKLDSPNAVE
jgi:hypothetical protein